MVESLNKKWKELLFAFSGFGPNFLMVLMGSYYSDALNPAAFGGNETFQTMAGSACLIVPALFPILYALGKAFDGIIDIPFAHITDTFFTKWGNRRPVIAISFFPMVISFVLSWIPLGGVESQLINTLWFTLWNVVFFASYTMCLICSVLEMFRILQRILTMYVLQNLVAFRIVAVYVICCSMPPAKGLL